MERFCKTKGSEKTVAWMYAACEGLRHEMGLGGGYAPVSSNRVFKRKILVRRGKLSALFLEIKEKMKSIGALITRETMEFISALITAAIKRNDKKISC